MSPLGGSSRRIARSRRSQNAGQRPQTSVASLSSECHTRPRKRGDASSEQLLQFGRLAVNELGAEFDRSPCVGIGAMVRTRPPMRSRASRTSTSTPASCSARAAASPAAPAPITTTTSGNVLQLGFGLWTRAQSPEPRAKSPRPGSDDRAQSCRCLLERLGPRSTLAECRGGDLDVAAELGHRLEHVGDGQ